MLVFASEEGLKHLGASRRWFSDGTFSAAPSVFDQLYAIRALWVIPVFPVRMLYCLGVRRKGNIRRAISCCGKCRRCSWYDTWSIRHNSRLWEGIDYSIMTISNISLWEIYSAYWQLKGSGSRPNIRKQRPFGPWAWFRGLVSLTGLLSALHCITRPT